MGSLHLEGVVFHETDAMGDATGVVHHVNPFTITDIPEPTTFLIWSLLATLGIGAYGRQRRRM